MHMNELRSAAIRGPPIAENLRMREARRGDTSAITALFRADRMGVELETVGWVISHPEIDLFVATTSGDKIIGLVTLYHGPSLTKGGRVGSINELFVAPEWRRRGVARMLLRGIVQRAKSLAIKRLEMRISAESGFQIAPFLDSEGFLPKQSSIFVLGR